MSKPFRLSLLLHLVAPVAFSSLQAQGNSHGPESPIVVGTIIELPVGGDVIVQQKAGGHRRHLKLTNTSRVFYHHFAGIGRTNVDQPALGFVVKANVTHREGIDIVNRVDYSPPLGEDRPIPDKLELSTEELFQRTDHNQNGEIDYVEYSLSIARSEKHFAGGFKPGDTDENDALNLAEFEEALKHVAWWMRAQKTLEEWHSDADTNKDGSLSPDEFKSFSGKPTHFKRTDDDKSGAISLEELADYLPTAKREGN